VVEQSLNTFPLPIMKGSFWIIKGRFQVTNCFFIHFVPQYQDILPRQPVVEGDDFLSLAQATQ
jgi:hypothetical protein